MNQNDPLFSSFERWPDWLFYAPVVLYWIYLALRHRGLTLPTNADPGIPFGGFIGESKLECLRLLGDAGKKALAPYTLVTVSGAADDAERAEEALRSAGLAYPIVAKPDIGKNGAGVRVVPNRETLAEYLAALPPGAQIILQKYISEEGEAGLFYIRYPHEAAGRLASLTLKYLPTVTGDGQKTLRELILADRRARKIRHLYFRRHVRRLDDVIPAGVEVRLVSVGNHCKGAIFKDGRAYVTPALEAALEKICQEMPGFYFGRFDARFKDLESLGRGEFIILEVNGAGSEMTHIWDARMTIARAYRDLLGQYRIAFEIGAENRARGYLPATLAACVRAWQKEHRLLVAYPWDE